MKILLIISLLCVGCVYPADSGNRHIISVTSGQNVLSEVYGPYYPEDQAVSLTIEQYEAGNIQANHQKDEIYYKMLQRQNKYKHTDNYFYIDEWSHTQSCPVWLIPPFLTAFCDIKLYETYVLIVFNNDKNCYAIVSSEENDEIELKSTASMSLINKVVTREKIKMKLDLVVEDGDLCK